MSCVSRCTWPVYGGPAACGPSSCSLAVQAPATVRVPVNGTLFVDACGVSGSSILVNGTQLIGAGCDVGSWAAGAVSGLATVVLRGTGAALLWATDAPLPYPAVSMVSLGRGFLSASVCVGSSVSAASVVALGASSLQLGSTQGGRAFRVFSNTSSDGVLASALQGATVVYSAGVAPRAQPPGSVTAFSSSQNFSLASLAGVPDAAIGGPFDVTLLLFGLAPGALEPDALSDLKTLANASKQRIANGFYGASAFGVQSPPGPSPGPGPSSYETATKTVAFWVPILTLLLFAIGTCVGLSSYLATRQQARADAAKVAPTVGARRLRHL